MNKTAHYLSRLTLLGSAAGAACYAYRRRQQTQQQAPDLFIISQRPRERSKMTVNRKFEALFAVPMHCESCVKDVSETLYKIDGISSVEANLKDQLVRIEGTAPPSTIVAAIEASGRDAILRGSGGSNSAAVSILETYYRDANTAPSAADYDKQNREVRGLARMVEVSGAATLIDLTLRGVDPGVYRISIRESGDLKDGVSSTGSVWKGGNDDVRGDLGAVEVGPDGRGSAFLDRPFRVWEVIGHALAVTRQDETTAPLRNDENTVVGVIARSAGVWDNDKTVCSCTGKTLWEERKDEVEKGML